jgi:hypothetical protein
MMRTDVERIETYTRGVSYDSFCHNRMRGA